MKYLINDTTLSERKIIDNAAASVANQKQAVRLINCLSKTGVDMIECGFFTREKVEELKKELNAVFDALPLLIDKGYRVMLCPKSAACYNEQEWIDMLRKTSHSKLDAFYIHNVSGLSEENLLCYYYLVEKYLKNCVRIGIHCHMDFSQKFPMIQRLCEGRSGRTLVLDSALLGIGDGVGMLNTELLLNALHYDFDFDNLLEAMDSIWMRKGKAYSWGYSPLTFLSAYLRVDTEYLVYIENRGHLPLRQIKEIGAQIDEEHRYEFEREYADSIYTCWRNNGQDADGIRVKA